MLIKKLRLKIIDHIIHRVGSNKKKKDKLEKQNGYNWFDLDLG